MDFEQLLFLEIFELLHKFGSNLKILANGNSVNMGNSARGRHLIAGELLSHSGHRRGRPWLCTSAGKALRGFSLLLSRSIRTSPLPFFAALVLYFLVAIAAAPSCICRRRSASTVSAKLVLVPPTPCAPSQPTLVT